MSCDILLCNLRGAIYVGQSRLSISAAALAHACSRAAASYFGATDTTPNGADRWALPSGHFGASRRLGRARFHGNVGNGRREDGSSDAGDDDDNDDGKASDAARAD
eukprot:3150854-Pyramimonas_sp.AAC.1